MPRILLGEIKSCFQVPADISPNPNYDQLRPTSFKSSPKSRTVKFFLCACAAALRFVVLISLRSLKCYDIIHSDSLLKISNIMT
jgi:hypothetical protein